MKIIHCADLHLDSPLRTNLSERQAGERNAELLRSFVRLTAYARDNGVQAVIIAGDLFDGERIRRRTVDEVLEAIRATPAVDYLYLPGNHDNAAHALFSRQLPENLRLFGKAWTCFEYEQAVIAGIEMTEQNAESLYQTLPHRADKANIVVLHGQVGTARGVDQVDLRALRDRAIDYLALGHIHAYSLARLDAHASYCYCGCLEGRGFDECGEKGFVLLDVSREQVSPSFVPFARRRLHRVEVDAAGLPDNAAILRKMQEAAAGISPDDMVEFLLSGQTDPRLDLSAPYLQRNLQDCFYFCRVKDQTRVAADPAALRNDVSLKGAFTMLALAEDEGEAEKAAMIRAGLAALSGEEILL